MSRYGALSDDRLQLVLLGPGYGESVMVRVPGTPAGWLVVDSLLDGRGEAAEHLVLKALADLEAEPDLVLLTHPHADHAGGMSRLVERYATRACFAMLDIDYAAARNSSVRRAAAGVEARAATRAIELLPATARWNISGPPVALGDGTITILHPSPERVTQLLASACAGPNLFASVARIDWRGRSLLLGADLERDEWAPLGDLSGLDPVKIPHHGSPGAHDPAWVGANRSMSARTMLVAPFNRKPKLPDLDDPRGIPGVLDYVDAVHLTALPFETATPQHGLVAIGDLRAARDRGGPSALPSALGVAGPRDARPNGVDAWLLAELDAGGTCEVRGGPTNLTITT